jgi:hypothetical protein
MLHKNSGQRRDTQSKNWSQPAAEICASLEVIESMFLEAQAAFKSSTELIRRLNARLDMLTTSEHPWFCCARAVNARGQSTRTQLDCPWVASTMLVDRVPRQLEGQLRRIANHLHMLRHS